MPRRCRRLPPLLHMRLLFSRHADATITPPLFYASLPPLFTLCQIMLRALYDNNAGIRTMRYAARARERDGLDDIMP